MRTVTVTLVAATLLALISPRLQAEMARWQSDYETARAQAKKSDQPMLLHFYADWCFPCKRMEQDVLSRPAVLQVLSSRMVLVKINVDLHPQLAQRFHVSQFPSDVVVDPAGERILSSTGYMEADKYVAFARQAQQQYSGNRPAPAASEPVHAEASPVMVAMDGYCPVTLATRRSWVKGSTEFASEHRGQVYYLVSREEKTAFDADPRSYVPQLLGCDAVILRDTDLAVPGSVRFGAFYDDELYLFSSQENRQAFKAEPERYTRTRVVRSADEIDSTILR